MAFVTSVANQGVTTLRFVGADGVQAPPEVVTDGSEYPQLALGARGDAIVAWYDSEKRLWARYRPVGGVLGPQEQVAAGVDRFRESNAVALDAAGTATFVWSPERRDERGGLRIATRSEGGVWSTPQTIAGYRVYASELAVTDNGFRGPRLASESYREAFEPQPGRGQHSPTRRDVRSAHCRRRCGSQP